MNIAIALAIRMVYVISFHFLSIITTVCLHRALNYIHLISSHRLTTSYRMNRRFSNGRYIRHCYVFKRWRACFFLWFIFYVVEFYIWYVFVYLINFTMYNKHLNRYIAFYLLSFSRDFYWHTALCSVHVLFVCHRNDVANVKHFYSKRQPR